MVAFSAIDPVSMDVLASTTVSGVGYLLTNNGTNNNVDLTADGEVCIGVSAGESSRDADGVLETSGATVSMFPLGGVMMVASKASQTYTPAFSFMSGPPASPLTRMTHRPRCLVFTSAPAKPRARATATSFV